jgi:hypothetical protein
MSWWFSRGWEEYFTVVQWDQRSAGKTYLLTDPATIAPTLTSEPMIADTEEMTAWVRRELGTAGTRLLGAVANMWRRPPNSRFGRNGCVAEDKPICGDLDS